MTSESSVIPIRHSSLPGMVRLPPRYKPDRKSPPEPRKGNVGQHQDAIGMADRMSDMSQALLWLKQELVRHNIIHDFFTVILQHFSLNTKKQIDAINRPFDRL